MLFSPGNQVTTDSQPAPSSKMSPMSPTQSEAPLKVAVIDGSTGFRLAIATIIQQYFPGTAIEDVDPYSQTLRGAGFSFGSPADAIVLGGVGTEGEANDALKRLRSRENCPSIIMLVAGNLMALRDSLLAAGAFEVLRKDALSGQRLRAALQRAFALVRGITDAVSSSPAGAVAGAVASHPSYGKFFFVANGERVGVEIDGYRCLSHLTSGQLAQVFFAENIETGNKAAIKLLTATPLHNTRGIADLCNISRRLAVLRGKDVVNEIDSGIATNFPYVVLEFLAKGDLRRRLKNPFVATTAIQIMRRLMAALAALHAQGVCHADLKPESVFFRADESVVLIDFNISTRFGRAVRSTTVGDTLGTPTYMSPEQGAGRPVDARSDLYSAGIIFYEMLTCVAPFSADTAAQTIFHHLHNEVPLLPQKIRHLQPVVDRLLAKFPSERYQSAAEVIAALASFVEQPVGTRPADPV